MVSSNPRRWIGHDAVAVAFDGPDGAVCVVRDPVTAAMSGRSWVDSPGRPGRYMTLPLDVFEFCKRLKAATEGRE